MKRDFRDKMLNAVPYFIVGVFIAMLIVIALTAYELATVAPEDVGAFFGRIASGFHGASK